MKNLIIVKAKIKVLTEDEGGKRKIGFASGYRPDHFFELSENGSFLSAFMGDIVFDGQDFIYPGEEMIVTVRFIYRKPILRFIEAGRKWSINEANNRIANAEIIEILSL